MDMVGGDRLAQLVCLRRNEVAAAPFPNSPYVPLLFMGEEYANQHRFAM